MNRREFFKGLLGAGTAVAGISVLSKVPVPIKQTGTSDIAISELLRQKEKSALAATALRFDTDVWKEIRTNYVPGAYLDLTKQDKYIPLTATVSNGLPR